MNNDKLNELAEKYAPSKIHCYPWGSGEKLTIIPAAQTGFKAGYVQAQTEHVAREKDLLDLIDSIDEISFQNGYHSVSRLCMKILSKYKQGGA